MAGSTSTSICSYNKTDIFVREKNLCKEVVGNLNFTEFLYYLILGEMPTEQQRIVVDAALITLAEHGLSPGAVASRLTYMGAPESLQGAVAVGILGVGDQFVGTVELTAPLLQEMVAADDQRAAAKTIIARHKAEGKLMPGFGQPHHKPDDPRPAALFDVALKAGVEGKYVAALKLLSEEVDASMGRHITINGPAAIAAVFLEIGMPIEIMRGFVVICRAAGIVAHVREEQVAPIGRTLWKASSDAVTQEGPAGH